MNKPKQRYCKKCEVKLHPLRIGSLCGKCQLEKKRLKLEKHKQTKTYQKETIKSLKRIEWSLTSKLVRLTACKGLGYANCYTCGELKSFEEGQCGHYIHGSLDHDLRNLKFQCVKCNHNLSGNLGKYAEHLIKDHGTEWLTKLRLDANTEKPRTIEEIKDNIEKLKLELNKIK